MKLMYINIVKQNMLMTSELLRILDLLKLNNIEAIPFKGPALSQMIYGDIASRQYADLDILIKEKDFDSLISILKELNYISKLNYELSKEKLKNIIPDHLFINQKSNILLEIHNKLFSINFPINISSINFFEDKQRVNINNKNIETFSNEYLLFYLCLHGCKHLFTRLSWLLDIHRLITFHEINWNKFIEMVEENNVKSLIYSSLFLSEYIFHTELPNLIKLKNKRKYSIIMKYILENKDDFEVTDKFSFVHLLMFDTFKEKFLYSIYIFRPSFIDYQSLSKEYKIELLYYLVRPFNILKRFIKNLK